MSDRIRAFILAAGFGERLRPVTDHIPKPLLPILGTPLIQVIIEKLSSLPVEAIGANLHHKAALISAWLAGTAFAGKVTLFAEDRILGTGGALKNAEHFLGKGPFIVHNGDVLSDIDIGRLLDSHLPSGNLVTLAVHRHPALENLSVDTEGSLIQARADTALPGEVGRFAFTGVAVYNPQFLSLLPPGRSDVVDAWNRAVSQGFTIGTFDATGCRWSDIGTPMSYGQTVRDVLRDNGERLYIGERVKGCGTSCLRGWVVIEGGVSLGVGASLKDCIVLPGTDVPANASLTDCIIGPNLEITHRRSSGPERSEDEPELVGTGGSDRTYHRIRHGDTTAVLMTCRRDDPDFRRHIEVTRFFRDCRVPVPELLAHDDHTMTALFEDLGDTSLYDWLKCPRSPREIMEMYKEALDGLVLLHSVASARVNECPSAAERVFDYHHCRWETNYFLERFVAAVKGFSADVPQTIEEECHRLALVVDAYEKTTIHRDFQSQNIMVTAEGKPRFVDYQGTRIGPPAYDLASLLWDPYFRLDEGMREELVMHYVKEMKTANGRFESREFIQSLLPCRLQRHMQALGAYGYLSLVKGKRYFLKHTSEGLRLLRDDVTAAKQAYPALHDLVMRL